MVIEYNNCSNIDRIVSKRSKLHVIVEQATSKGEELEIKIENFSGSQKARKETKTELSRTEKEV